MDRYRSVMRSLITFFSLTYVLSWICFTTWAKLVIGAPSAQPPAVFAQAILLTGVFAPALVALALTERSDGRAGTLRLLRRAIFFPADARWYVFAITYIFVIKLAAALLHRLATGAWPAFGHESVLVMMAATLVSTPVQAGEEIGWRGYALPRLAIRFGLGPASLVLGVIWACWHLPFFFISVTDKFGQSFPLYALQVTAVAVASAWLYWRTKGSVFITMLLHAAVNNTKDIVPSAVSGVTKPFAFGGSLVEWLTVALLWTVGAYFLVQMWSETVPGWERPVSARGLAARGSV